MDAREALERLKAGNKAHQGAVRNDADVSARRRRSLAEEGQRPYAVVVACSDSRVVPEHLFTAGVGELFTVRVAGNVVGPTQAASVSYAVGSLGAPLVVVMGHTRCGAVAAAIAGSGGEPLAPVTELVRKAIGEERDDRAACELNVRAGVRALEGEPGLRTADGSRPLVVGAVCDVASGAVEFLDEA